MRAVRKKDEGEREREREGDGDESGPAGADVGDMGDMGLGGETAGDDDEAAESNFPEPCWGRL